MGICINQLNLLIKCRKYLENHKRQIINFPASPFYYLNSWAPKNSIGYYILYNLNSRVSLPINVFCQYLKSLLAIRHLLKYRQRAHFENTSTKSKTLIITWGVIDDFKSGVFRDRYFKIPSNQYDDILWLVIGQQDLSNVRLQNNVVLIYPSKFTIRVAIECLNSVFKTGLQLFSGKFNCKNLINFDTFFGCLIVTYTLDIINRNKIQTILQPYEAQPFQHLVNVAVNKKYPKIQTLGYLHSALPALPSDLIYRYGAPSILFVHGQGQIKILNKFLNWPSSTLKFTPSLRYRKEDKIDNNGQIFFPYGLDNLNLILSSLEIYLQSIPDGSHPLLRVRNHPVQRNSKSHIQLEEMVNDLLIKYKVKFDESNETKVSWLIGLTASILEALEGGVDVIHIATNPLNDVFSQCLWDKISVKQFNENLFKYKLKELCTYISRGSEIDEKYFLNKINKCV